VQILEISPIFEAISVDSVDFLNNVGMLRQRETERATKSCTRALIRIKKFLRNRKNTTFVRFSNYYNIFPHGATVF
jgi:hypothetical protein